jgi:hypothetical protein
MPVHETLLPNRPDLPRSKEPRQGQYRLRQINRRTCLGHFLARLSQHNRPRNLTQRVSLNFIPCVIAALIFSQVSSWMEWSHTAH